MAVPIRADGAPGNPAPAIAGRFTLGPANRSFEPTADGRRFVLLATEETGEGFTLVQNWRGLLARGTPR